MQKLVWQNANGVELDLTSGNYGITEWEGFSNASLNIQSQQVPFQDGGVFLDALIEQRELSVTLAMQDKNNLELRYQQRRELISALNPKLGEGYLIYTNDFISKRIKCIPQIPLFETHNSDTVGTPKASLSWTACEPYWEDLEETTVVLSTETTTEISNQGDAEIGFEIVIESQGNTSLTVGSLTEDNTITLKRQRPFVSNILISTKSGQKRIESITPMVETIDTGHNANKTITKGYDDFDNNLYVCSGETGTYKSSDMDSWTQVSSTIQMKKLIWNAVWRKFIGIDDTNVYLSTNATDWTTTSVSSLVNNLYDLCYNEIAGNVYFAGQKVLYTEDGTNISVTLNESVRCCCYNKYTNEVLMAQDNTHCYLLRDNGQWEIQPEVELPQGRESNDLAWVCVDNKGNYFMGSFWAGVCLVNPNFVTIGNYYAFGGYACAYDPIENQYICGGQTPFTSNYYLWVLRLINNNLVSSIELRSTSVTQISSMTVIDEEVFMCGERYIYIKQAPNMIQYLTGESDMGMKIEIGQNYFLLNYIDGDDPIATIKYRQKYIGV